MTSDPVEQFPDGKWWFWDEIWEFPHGPYDTKQEARKACLEHARRLDETTQTN